MGSEIIVNEETITKTIDSILEEISNMNNVKKNIENANNNLSLAWQSRSGDSFKKVGQNILLNFEKDIKKLEILKDDLNIALDEFTKLDLNISKSIDNS